MGGGRMRSVTIELDDETFQRMQHLAESRAWTVEQTIRAIVANVGSAGIADDTVSGLFSDEPELIDEVLDLVMQARERDPLR
jgi:predicted transcriptional regulator